MEFNKFINVNPEEESCLSFRDLSIYNNAKEWKNYVSSEESQEEGLFEFFNQEMTNNQFFHHQDIIFCGKIIPQENPIKDINHQKLKKKGEIGDYITFSQGNKKGLKSWYLLLFGTSKSFSQEMELRDLKRRQSSNNKVSSLSQLQLRKINDEKVNVNNIRCINKGKEKGLWWLIKKLSCSDSAYHAKGVVKASISYIPHVM